MKVSCILCHRGVQLILAYWWARPAILVAGKGKGECFYFFSFFPFPLFHLLYYIFYLFCPFLWETTQNNHWHVVKPQHNQICRTVKDMIWDLLSTNTVKPIFTWFWSNNIAYYRIKFGCIKRLNLALTNILQSNNAYPSACWSGPRNTFKDRPWTFRSTAKQSTNWPARCTWLSGFSCSWSFTYHWVSFYFLLTLFLYRTWGC